MAFNNLIKLISILVCISVSSYSFAKDNAPSNGNIIKLNQTLESHKKDASSLTKDLTSTLSVLRKTDSPNEEQVKLIGSLEKASDWLSQIADSIATTQSYGRVIENSEKLIAEVEKKLNQPIKNVKAGKIKGLSLEELNDASNQVNLDLETERNHRTNLDSKLNLLNERREKISINSKKLNERLQILNQTLNSIESQKTGEAGNSDLLRNIETLFINQKLLELEWEQRSFDIRREILRNERQLAEKKVLSFEQNAALIQGALNLARTKVATESIATAEITSKKLESAHPVIQKVLSMNQSLATESAEVSVRITALTTEKQSLEQELEYFRQSFSSMKDKINSAGLSDTIGLRLRNAKNQLPDLSTFSKQHESRRNEVDRVQLRRIELEDRLLELVNINKEIEIKLNEVPFTDLDERKKVERQLALVLNEQKNQFLPNTLKSYDNYFEKTLVPFLEREKEYINLINDYDTYIDERILWVKSSQVFSHTDFIQSLKSISWVANPSAWTNVIYNLVNVAKSNLFITIIICLSIIVSLYIRKQLISKIKHYGRYKTKLSLAKFSDSLKSGVITLVLASYWPIFFWLVALAIFKSGATDPFSQAVAYGLLSSANVLFFVFLFLQMVRSSGLAETHFRWKNDNIALIKRQLIWFGPTVIPFVFLLQTTNNQPIQNHFDGLGRLAFICITVLMTVLIYKLMNPQKGLFKEEISQHKEGWLNRTRYLWLYVILSLPIILGATAIFGYLYTATELMMLLIDSFWIVLGAIITRGFLIRWLNIAQRKLAIEQARKRLTLQAELEGTAQEKVVSDASSPVNHDGSEVDLGQISHQTYKLLNNFTGLAIGVGLYLIWADILPALNMLDNITLWESGSTLVDGQTVATSITLTNGLAALAIILVTTLVGVNIPGLLEIAILQRLPFTPSARYGITTIARYIIIILGTILTFNAIGIGWSKVQWLAAAITVGLGFGLQEIFANFVSGIIILIERQIRVGDAVTVGDISGRVSKIKMRATTIVDWDKKELIIPNKEFVTGQVVNWTLSDNIIRLVIPIGIAYGSDTQKAHDILLQIANSNEHILNEPQPEAFFSGFGESTLDFELRVFLPNSDLRIPMRHDLLMQIDQEFRKANIEIAFPQRDLHIRSLPENMELKPKKG